eukprot:SAG22_NODE_1968_length_3235_cov_2.232143_3_plen_75_part_00
MGALDVGGFEGWASEAEAPAVAGWLNALHHGLDELLRRHRRAGGDNNNSGGGGDGGGGGAKQFGLRKLKGVFSA